MRNNVQFITIFDEIVQLRNNSPKNNNIIKDGNTYKNVKIFDHSIFYECNIKGIIHSNENSNENEPHIHVIINKTSTLVVSLLNFRIIKEDKNIKSNEKIKALEFVHFYYEKAKNVWNNVCSKHKIN